MSNQLLLRRRASCISNKRPNYLRFTALNDGSSVALIKNGEPYTVHLEYNKNKSGWQPYVLGNAISIDANGYVEFRGENYYFTKNASNYYQFRFNGDINASGDITSMINNIGGDTPLPQMAFFALFAYCTSLITAPELPTTSLSSFCYYSLFYGCNRLIQSPYLPADIVLWQSMESMFYGCSSVLSYRIKTISGAKNVFVNNSACRTLTIYDVNPPEIFDNTISGLKSDCLIYVPYSADHSILDAYKAAQYWSDRADYIFELDENGEIPS